MPNSAISFEKFIEKKPLFYKEIDHARVHKAYAILAPHIQKPMVIHVVGTNGKGSTGRIMATLLHESKKRVGHFSSPHILKFNERIWMEGADSSDGSLEMAHLKLYGVLEKEISEGLSYFEYTTLLALVAMEELDIIVLEAGLGGEFDATNVVSKALSVITPIGIDHQNFLGESVEEIARTKLNSMEKKVVLARQKYDEVYKIAEEIATQKGAMIYRVEIQEDMALLERIESLGWAYYLYENTKLALKALDILEFPYSLNDLKKVKLFGRFYQLSSNVTIDVGHNLLATEAIVKILKNKNEKIVLIYNTLEDKEYEKILALFAPFLKSVELLSITTPRVVDSNLLYQALEKLSLPYENFTNIKDENNYLVFGSFYVVEEFIRRNSLNLNNN
jgi:dihydrofolate synthase/folylpolyglutamate synthase